VAFNGCDNLTSAPHLEDTVSQAAVMESSQPLLLVQQRLTSATSMAVGCEEQGITIAESQRNDEMPSVSNDQEHISLTSSRGPVEVHTMNGSAAESGVGDNLNVTDVQTDNLLDRLTENADNFVHISVVDESSASHLNRDTVFLSSVNYDSNLPTSTETDVIDMQPVGVAVIYTLADTSPKDSRTVHEQLVSYSECISTALLDAASLPRLRHDRHSVSSISSDTCASSINLGARTGSDILPDVVSISQSSDKLWSWPARRERIGFESQSVGVVRSSWSQENYFDDSDITCVDIDLDDDDDLASSVDVLHYRDTAVDAQAYSWTEDDIGHGDGLCTGKLRSWAPLKGDEVFSELFSSDTESSLGDKYSATTSDFRKKATKTYGVGVAIDFDPSTDTSDAVISSRISATGNAHSSTNWNGIESSSGIDDNFYDDIISFSPSVFSNMATRPSTKDVDRPSAARLAKRLYYLQGFRKSDISRHLTKKYDVVCTSSFLLAFLCMMHLVCCSFVCFVRACNSSRKEIEG